jgi:RimJ/RimL family protein N-acetyltransferase
LITGRLVNLKRLGLDHLSYIHKWRNDQELMSFYGLLPCASLVKVELAVKNEIQSKDRLDLIVETMKGDVIGAAWLKRINWRVRTCELNIMIAEKDFRSKIFGLEAEFLLLKYSMQELNMHKVYAKIVEFAHESQRLALEAGFKQEAVFRKATYQKGKYWDLLVFGLLQHEFEAFLASPRGQKYLSRSRRTYSETR